MEKKAPTLFQLLGISVLVGTIVGLISAFYGPLSVFAPDGPGTSKAEYILFVIRCIPVPILFVFMGAGIGVFTQKTGAAKWRGLWIWIIIFSLCSIFAPFFLLFLGR